VGAGHFVEEALSWKQEVGAPVFIVVRCIAATRAAGTAYELINQSINQSINSELGAENGYQYIQARIV
jgi:hypothetical protein